MSATERIRKKGKELLQIGLDRNADARDRYERLNEHQRGMVRGWLGKLKVWSVEEGLSRIEARIHKDSRQGRR